MLLNVTRFHVQKKFTVFTWLFVRNMMILMIERQERSSFCKDSNTLKIELYISKQIVNGDYNHQLLQSKDINSELNMIKEC